MEDPSELDGNVSSSYDDDALGEVLEVEEPIAVKAKLGALDSSRSNRLSSNGDDRAIGGDDALDVGSSSRLGVGRGDRDGVGVDEAGSAGEESYVVLLDVWWELQEVRRTQRGGETGRRTSLVDAVEALDVLVALGLESRPVDLHLLVRKVLVAVRSRLVELLPASRKTSISSPPCPPAQPSSLTSDQPHAT